MIGCSFPFSNIISSLFSELSDQQNTNQLGKASRPKVLRERLVFFGTLEEIGSATQSYIQQWQQHLMHASSFVP